MKTRSWLSALALLVVCGLAPVPSLADEIQWLNHLGFLAGTPAVTQAFDGNNGLKLSAPATGDYAIAQGLQLPPGFLVNGVRICYDLTDVGSFITQVRINQLGIINPLIIDNDDLLSTNPVCENISLPSGPVDTTAGPLTLVLGLHYGSTPQNILVTGIGLLVAPDPASPLQGWLNHTHDYLTGKGVGHNNVVASTGGPMSHDEEPDPVVPPKNNGKNK